MLWKRARKSDRVIDARGRGMGGARGASIGGGGLLIMLLVMWLLGMDPSTILQFAGNSGLGGGGLGATQSQTAGYGSGGYKQTNPQAADPARDFVASVLGDLEDTWGKLYSEAGGTYPKPELVLFSDRVASACGVASAQAGPFYCPSDRRVYLDLSFFSELKRLGGSGDFAVAYVIAHEVGHHIQNTLGLLDEVQRLKPQMQKIQANALQVKVELQADCYAGIWAHNADRYRGLLEQGDIEEGLKAAAAVGDDHLQKRSTGVVRPESFTHGSSEQRMKAFLAGYQNGTMQSCAI